MFYETGKRDRTLLPHDPFKAIVTPRPIGWISTRSLDGRINLAPYSFFNAFGGAPPIVGFSSEGFKDSAAFAAESGEFVANLASLDLMRPMSETSAPLPRARSRRSPAGRGRTGRVRRRARARRDRACPAGGCRARAARPRRGLRPR